MGIHIPASYTVYYPSGRTLLLDGTFAVAATAVGAISPGIRLRAKPESLVTLDPRAVVTRDGLVIYEPRRIRFFDPELAGWVSPWLVEHPEWPSTLIQERGLRSAQADQLLD